MIIYVTSPRHRIEGAFRVERVLEAPPGVLWRSVARMAGVTYDEFHDYFDGKEVGFGIVIRDRFQLKRPIHLQRMRTKRLLPPQGYQYLPGESASALIRGA